MSVFFTADSCDSLGLCIPDGMLRVFFENSFILRVRSRARPKLKLRAWSTGEGCFNNRSQRPQPCDLHGEDLELERSAERPTRAVVETVDEVSPPTLVETERGKALEK